MDGLKRFKIEFGRNESVNSGTIYNLKEKVTNMKKDVKYINTQIEKEIEIEDMFGFKIPNGVKKVQIPSEKVEGKTWQYPGTIYIDIPVEVSKAFVRVNSPKGFSTGTFLKLPEKKFLHNINTYLQDQEKINLQEYADGKFHVEKTLIDFAKENYIGILEIVGELTTSVYNISPNYEDGKYSIASSEGGFFIDQYENPFKTITKCKRIMKNMITPLPAGVRIPNVLFLRNISVALKSLRLPTLTETCNRIMLGKCIDDVIVNLLWEKGISRKSFISIGESFQILDKVLLFHFLKYAFEEKCDMMLRIATDSFYVRYLYIRNRRGWSVTKKTPYQTENYLDWMTYSVREKYTKEVDSLMK